ncbi:hypothetical protein EV368DRAFT_81491 [Lentinula lateritia]|nr:hypothetical protein EV368DRAFT_81491 [Lentinula lateritia]
MDYPMDDAPAFNEPPSTNNSETPAPASHLRQRLGLIRHTVEDTDIVNESATSATSPLNRRRKLSTSDPEDAQSSSHDGIGQRPNKVTDFKVHVVERVVEREVLPAVVREQLSERDERIHFLQQELEKNTNTVQDSTLRQPQPKAKQDSGEVERWKLREDVLDKGKTIVTLTALTNTLRENAAELRRDVDALREELKNTKQSSDTVDEELKKSKVHFLLLSVAMTLTKVHLPLQRDADGLHEKFNETKQSSNTVDEELKKVKRDTDALREELKNTKRNRIESKTQILRYEKQVKDLETSIATKESQMQTLNSTVQTLETEKAQLEANVVAAGKKLVDESLIQTAQFKQYEQRIKEFEESIALKDSHALELKTTIQSLEMEKGQLQENAAAENSNTEAVRAALEKLREETRHTLASKNSQMESLDTKIMTLETEKRQLETSVTAEKEGAAAEKLKIEADHAALEKSREETRAGATRLHELEQTVNDLQHTLASKNSQMESLDTKIMTLETEKRQLETSVTAEKPRIEADRAALKELRDKNKVIKKSWLPQISFLNASIQAGKIQTNQLEERVKDLEASLTSRDSHTQTLDSMIQVLEADKRRLQANATAEKPQIDADRAALNKFRNENQGLHAQALKSKIQRLESEKQKLEATWAQNNPRSKQIMLLCANSRMNLKNMENHPSESVMEKLLAENATLKSLASQDRSRLLSHQSNHVTKARFNNLEEDYYKLQETLSQQAQEIVLLKQVHEIEIGSAGAHEIQILRESLTKVQAQNVEEKLTNSHIQACLAALQNEIAALTHERNELKSRVPPEGGTSDFQHTITKLHEQCNQKQGRVAALEQEIAGLIRERDSLKESSENGPLISQIEELRAERNRYKDELHAQSAGRYFLSSRKNRTLSRVNVNAEMGYARKIFPSYRLVDPLTIQSNSPPRPSQSNSPPRPSQSNQSNSPPGPSQSYSSPGPSRSNHSGPSHPSSSHRPGFADAMGMNNHSTRSSNTNKTESNGQRLQPETPSRTPYRAPWQKDRFSPFLMRPDHDTSDSDNDDCEQRKSSRKKGKRRATSFTESESSSQSSSDEESASDADVDADGIPIESGISQVAKRYSQKGTRSSWSRSAQRNQVNKLLRRIIRKTLGGSKNYQLFVRPGVSDARLKNFEQNPQLYGPKIRNTVLDKRGLTTQQLAE